MCSRIIIRIKQIKQKVWNRSMGVWLTWCNISWMHINFHFSLWKAEPCLQLLVFFFYYLEWFEPFYNSVRWFSHRPNFNRRLWLKELFNESWVGALRGINCHFYWNNILNVLIFLPLAGFKIQSNATKVATLPQTITSDL